jgi:hypothetical protein
MKSLAIASLVGFLFGLWANALQTHGISVFTETAASRKGLISRAFFLSSQISDRIFGDRLFSVRAIGWSLFLSVGFFTFCFLGAIYTTPWLSTIVYNTQITFDLIPSIFLLMMMLFLEYIYVTKTRWILKTIVANYYSQSWKIFGFFFIDIISTYWMLVVGLSLMIFAMMYCMQIYSPNINISKSIFFSPILENYGEAQQEILSYGPSFDAYDLIGYINVVVAIVQRIFEEFRSQFAA